MGNRNNYKYATYEDIQKNNHIIINTLPLNEQSCLIKGTVRAEDEERIINAMLERGGQKQKIIVYGKHYMDETVYKKYDQFIELGFQVRIYVSGMFEWMLLQEVYGNEHFPTTSRELDILKFKPQHPVSHCAETLTSGESSLSLI